MGRGLSKALGQASVERDLSASMGEKSWAVPGVLGLLGSPLPKAQRQQEGLSPWA